MAPHRDWKTGRQFPVREKLGNFTQNTSVFSKSNFFRQKAFSNLHQTFQLQLQRS